MFTPLAEQLNYTGTTCASVRKHLTEQHDNHVQSFQTDSYSVPISSQTVRQSRRVSKKPSYLSDYVLLCTDTVLQCDTCGKFCACKRNIVRYVKEVHSSTAEEHWNYPEFRCSSNFVRRRSLAKHLMKSHGHDRLTASAKAVNAQRGDRMEYYEKEMEDVSADDSILDVPDDIEELKNTGVQPVTDQNNNDVFDKYVKPGNVKSISDLEDISDSDLLNVDDTANVVSVSVDEELSIQTFWVVSGASAMNGYGNDNSVIDTGDSDAGTIEGSIIWDYEDDIMIDGDVSVDDADGVDDRDSIEGENGVSGDDYSVESDDDEEVDDKYDNDYTSEQDTDNNFFIIISDDEVNEDQTVAIPEVTRVVQTLTLTLRRTTTYSQ